MIWLMVFAPIVLVLIVLLAGRLQVAISFDGSGVNVYFSYLGFEKKISRDEKEKKEPEKEVADTKTSAGKILRGLRAVPDYVLCIRKFFSSFAYFGEIPELKVEGEYGTGDPYQTGISYGFIQSVGGVVRASVPQFELGLVPDFNESVYDIKMKGRGRIRLGSLLYVILLTFLYLPKRQTWKLIREK